MANLVRNSVVCVRSRRKKCVLNSEGYPPRRHVFHDQHMFQKMRLFQENHSLTCRLCDVSFRFVYVLKGTCHNCKVFPKTAWLYTNRRESEIQLLFSFGRHELQRKKRFTNRTHTNLHRNKSN